MSASHLAKYTINCIAKNIIVIALSENEYNKVLSCSSAKAMWDKLANIHEGTSQFKDTNIGIVVPI